MKNALFDIKNLAEHKIKELEGRLIDNIHNEALKG